MKSLRLTPLSSMNALCCPSGDHIATQKQRHFVPLFLRIAIGKPSSLAEALRPLFGSFLPRNVGDGGHNSHRSLGYFNEALSSNTFPTLQLSVCLHRLLVFALKQKVRAHQKVRQRGYLSIQVEMNLRYRVVSLIAGLLSERAPSVLLQAA